VNAGEAGLDGVVVQTSVGRATMLPPAGAGLAAANEVKPPGHECPLCGGWVVNTQQHVVWHMQLQQVGQYPAATGSEAARIADAHWWASLRDALGPREK
jgi:hypothetical protein